MPDAAFSQSSGVARPGVGRLEKSAVNQIDDVLSIKGFRSQLSVKDDPSGVITRVVYSGASGEILQVIVGTPNPRWHLHPWKRIKKIVSDAGNVVREALEWAFYTCYYVNHQLSEVT